jgi:hypothetical protein
MIDTGVAIEYINPKTKKIEIASSIYDINMRAYNIENPNYSKRLEVFYENMHAGVTTAEKNDYFTYDISDGTLNTPDGKLYIGYSGKGIYKNDPNATHIRNKGPIPAGEWGIVGYLDHNKLGPNTITLDKKSVDSQRDNFLIHADNKNHPGQASNGCIIMPKFALEEIVEYILKNGLPTLYVKP